MRQGVVAWQTGQGRSGMALGTAHLPHSFFLGVQNLSASLPFSACGESLSASLTRAP